MNNRNSLLDLTQLFLIFIFFLLPIIYNSRGSWKTTWNNHFYFIYLTNNNSRLRLSYIVGRKKKHWKIKTKLQTFLYTHFGANIPLDTQVFFRSDVEMSFIVLSWIFFLSNCQYFSVVVYFCSFYFLAISFSAKFINSFTLTSFSISPKKVKKTP